MAIGYDAKVWKSIKELWEVSPKTTGLRSILEQVSSMLDCEVPRYQTVSTRMKEENWKKLTKIELKKRAAKSDETTTENQQFFSSKIELKKEIKTVGCEDSHSSEKKAKKKAERAAKKPMNLDVIDLPPSVEILVKSTANKKANMIGALRAQALNVFNITNICVQGLADFITELELIDPETCEEAEINALDWKLRAFERAANILESLSRTNEKNIKMHIGLYGYTGDDFVDRAEIEAEKAEVMKDLDVLLEEKKQLMAEQQALAFSRDLSAIEDKMRNG
jgi:hypothetical protein